MSHPRRYAHDDPYLARLRTICLALPEASEKESHGHPNFYTKKVFAVFGAVVKGDHYNDRWAQSVLVLPNLLTREAALSDERFFVPAYYGPYGWIGLDFRAAEVDWDELADLVEESYRNTAPARLIKLLP
ncbi:MmcQ/YjbR family DNA-binding protein [Micropruina sp.]|uniref:MmcQ/YjbR family DNA-binding protein n=1 Tax=Micropruina sp. TaxID=2737536 RepID=UPI002605D1B9|nr:MmcQ/YjbR family DNA-binding protein [Micropruina sp.]